ncbi:MAG: hypothetical protein J6R00_06230 [Lentisphaeria bacterium]|nr:hypothetical protein [Lentisphaeria bacterium]
MAIFTSKCPCCNAELQLDDDWIGKKGLCPICQEHFIINKNNGYTPPKATPPPPPQSFTNFNQKATPPPPPQSFTNFNQKITPIKFRTVQNTKQSYVNDSYDLKEDEFVLQYLKASKTWNFIYHLLLAVALVVVGIILCCDDKEEAGIFCFLSLLPLINAYFLREVLLSWFRGVYRNLLQ